jgi:uncharacterized membrane protein
VSPAFAAAGFPGKHQAERALDALEDLQHQDVVSLDDAVIVVKTPKGVKLHQQRQVSIGEGVVAGGVLGVIVGLLFGFPVLAPVVGMVLGVATGLFFDSGIYDERLRELGDALEPGQAALCIQVAADDWPLLRDRIEEHTADLIVAELTPDPAPSPGAD